MPHTTAPAPAPMPAPAPASAAGAVSGGHGAPARRRIVRNLALLGSLYEELAHALTYSRRIVEKVSERGSPGIPLNTRALDVRDDIRTVLAGWAALVCEERRVGAPARETAALTAFLTRHAGWLATHTAAADLAEETGELVRSAWSVLSGHRDRSLPVGACVRPGCEGRLAARLGPRGPWGEAAVVCSADPRHTWSPEAWHTLGTGRTRPARGAGLTAQQISAHWHIASGTVYWLASTHHWGRRKEGRRVLYDRDDVLATMHPRTTGPALAG
ncbi:hypothetical protein [Streptomyces sp. I05A-00742]|uniref:hypothetical protein n=1 Tax=Streptomyces sp. I05A-00742 TaxID=2732853 RepID=UPI001BB1AA0E|nr:hypothetical protein [Streptomyces sp. I05A-00742]